MQEKIPAMKPTLSSMQLYLSQHDKGIMETRGPLSIMPDEPPKPRVRPESRGYYDRNWRGTGVAEAMAHNEFTLKPPPGPGKRKMRTVLCSFEFIIEHIFLNINFI